MTSQALDPAAAKLAVGIFERVARGQGASVLDRARQLAKTRPSAPDAHHALALSAAQAELWEEAWQAFDRALSLAPGHPVILANFARFLGRRGEFQLASESWCRYLQSRQGDATAWQELGWVKLAHARSLMRGGMAWRSTVEGLVSDSARAFQQALELDESLARAWHGLASALRDQQQLQSAEDALRKALSLAGESTLLWASLGGLLRLLGRSDEAVDCYRRARALGELDPAVLDAEVGALVDCLELERAHSAVQELIAGHPRFAPAYSTRANLEWEYGAESDVMPAQRFRESAARQPENLELQLGLIQFLLQIHEGREAFDRLQLLRRKNDDPRLVALQADALELCGDSERAGGLYALADKALGDRDIRFINAYARHLLKTGQAAKAEKRALSVLRIDSFDQEALAYLATAWRLLSDPREEWLCRFDRFAQIMPVAVPDGWTDLTSFLADLRLALEPLHRANRQPVSQSLRGGSQTPGRLFGRSDPRIAALQRTLESTVEAWMVGLRSEPDHPFLSRVGRSVRFTGSWSVKLSRAGSHANHFHNEGWLSSAFYVALPGSVVSTANTDSPTLAGALQLGQPPEELNLGLEPRRVIRPRLGHLALFPSFMWHGTVPFHENEPRITVAFDMVPAS